MTVIGVLAISLLRSIYAMPAMPGLPLLEPKSLFMPAKAAGIGSSQAEPRINADKARFPASDAVLSTSRYAFLADWDENGIASLKKNANNIDGLIPKWSALDASGRLYTPLPTHRMQAATEWLRKNAPKLAIFPRIGFDDERMSEKEVNALSSLLVSNELRTQFANDLVNLLAKNKFNGAVVDFDTIPQNNYPQLVALVEETAAKLHAKKLKLIVAAPLHDPKFDYDAVARASDFVLLKVYDEHSREGAPGPVAGQAWLEQQLDDRLEHIDGAKFIITIGSFGYDWIDRDSVERVSIQEVWSLLKEAGASLLMDDVSLNPTFAFADEKTGEKHRVWFLDAVTAYNEAAAALAMDPHGIALYRLGSEDPGVWSFFRKGRLPDVAAQAEMKTLHAGYELIYRGEGEVLRVTGSEKTGARRFIYEAKANLIKDEVIVSLPEATTVTRWGGRKDKVIAITFDDGPDPRFTPKVLDILAEKNAKATFFIVGSVASANPYLLRRIYREGHDIGNHTFTHPDLSVVTRAQAELELNATQRLIEATVGVNTHLFRPPYGEDMEPETIDHAVALLTSTDLGYSTIGFQIDPMDWALPTKNQIVERAVAQAEQGAGNVLLLHDAGGDRSHTVAALPELIDALRAKGYRFVTIHELLNLDREAVMPVSRPLNSLELRANEIAFFAVDITGRTLSVLFILGVVLSSGRLIAIAVGAVIHARRYKRTRNRRFIPDSIAVIVPAYNEEKLICSTIRSLLASELKSFDIIVVDDGSKDDTYSAAKEAFAEDGRVHVYRKHNGGKASALNFGLKKTDAQIVIAMDADTQFAPDAIGLLVRHFENPEVGAVAGKATVGNRINLITRFQALEYAISQNFDRRALEIVGGVTVVPGAIGAWRREALLQIGGFGHATMAEDADATIAIQRRGWEVMTEPRAVAITEAPETISAFVKQRFRWMFGMVQVAYKNRGALADKRALGVKYCALPNIVIFQFLLALLSPIIDLALVFNLASVAFSAAMHPFHGTPQGLLETGAYWVALQLLEVAAAALALRLDRARTEWRLLPLLVIQRVGYRQILSWVAIKVAAAAIKGRLVGWGKLARTGRAIRTAATPNLLS